MATTAARKAWNEAMQTAAGGKLPIAQAGGNNSSVRGGASGAISTRRTSKRRGRGSGSSRRGASSSNREDDEEGGGNSSSNSGLNAAIEFRNAVRLDMLEGVDGSLDDVQDELAGEEEYDELEAYLEEGGGGGRKKKRKASPTPKKKKKTKLAKGALPDRFKPRSLASILLEESGRNAEGGIVQKYLDAEARLINNTTTNSVKDRKSRTLSTEEYNEAIVAARKKQNRKYCPVTGLEGIYTDPKSGIPYANLKALEQIRERPPPWMRSAAYGSASGGNASYYEACKSLRNED